MPDYNRQNNDLPMRLNLNGDRSGGGAEEGGMIYIELSFSSASCFSGHDISEDTAYLV